MQSDGVFTRRACLDTERHRGACAQRNAGRPGDGCLQLTRETSGDPEPAHTLTLDSRPPGLGDDKPRLTRSPGCGVMAAQADGKDNSNPS